MSVASNSQNSIELSGEAAGIPPRLAHCSKSSWEGVWPFGGPVDMALIHGPVGSGKSHLAAALCLQAVEYGTRPGYWKKSDYGPNTGGHTWYEGGVLFRDIQATIEQLKPNRERAEERLELLLGCVFLAFDDLGAERLTDWTLDRVSLILRHRYNQMLPTVVTTNLSPSELNKIDPRLASRLCSDLVHKCSGRDRRLK